MHRKNTKNKYRLTTTIMTNKLCIMQVSIQEGLAVASIARDVVV